MLSDYMYELCQLTVVQFNRPPRHPVALCLSVAGGGLGERYERQARSWVPYGSSE